MIKGKQANRNKKLEVRNWKLEMRSKKNWKEGKQKNGRKNREMGQRK